MSKKKAGGLQTMILGIRRLLPAIIMTAFSFCRDTLLPTSIDIPDRHSNHPTD